MNEKYNVVIRNIKIVLFIIGIILILLFVFFINKRNTIIKEVNDIEAEYWKIGHQISYENKTYTNSTLPEGFNVDEFQKNGMNNLGIMDDISKYIGFEKFKDSKYNDKERVLAEFKQIYPQKTYMYIYLGIGIILIICAVALKNKKTN